MGDKYIFYFSGGAMAGVFGAGVAAGLVEADFEKNYEIEAMYGSSAGVCTEAYYASRQPIPLGPSIYWENLTKGFILGQNIPFGVFQRFCFRYFGCYPADLVHAVNIDLVMDVLSGGKKALDIANLNICPFPLYVKLWDVRNKHWSFIDLRTLNNPLKVIKASVSVVPYYFNVENVDGIEYVDLCLADTLSFDLITARHPNSKIIFVANFMERNRRVSKIVHFLEGVVANWCFKEIDRSCFVRGLSKLSQDIEAIKSNPNMLLIFPPDNTPIKAFTTDSKKLIATYEIGKQEAQKIIDFAKHQ